jgi:hypothetical protein
MISKKSPDLDGLCLSFIKTIIHYIADPLAHIFSISLSKGIFPEKLKESRIVPIFKSGDPSNYDNYRPISLVNTLSKILEKIVSIKLTNYLQLNNLIYEHQYGFQRGLSTEHNLTHVINYICNAINDNNFCVGVFLDLRKAFDVCSHDILLKKLKKLGIEGNELEWFRSYLSNRKQRVEINNHRSKEKVINISVLQGTTLGPILFLCYINDLHLCTNLSLYKFADDTSCLSQGNNINDVIKFMNIEMQKISNWLTINKMALNISKTKYIIFRARGKSLPANLVPLCINTNKIGGVHDESKIYEISRVHSGANKEDQQYKLLGVYLDEFLSFDYHVNSLCTKLSRANFYLSRVSNLLSTNALKNLYHALFHPHLLYCLVITSCATKTKLNRITTLQKKAIRIINKAKKNQHANPLFIQSKILPFNDLIYLSNMKLMHSIYYNYAPKSFQYSFRKAEIQETPDNYNLRNHNLMIVPRFRVDSFKRCPMYNLPFLWNTANDVIHHNNPTTFQIALKHDLFENLKNS